MFPTFNDKIAISAVCFFMYLLLSPFAWSQVTANPYLLDLEFHATMLFQVAVPIMAVTFVGNVLDKLFGADS